MIPLNAVLPAAAAGLMIGLAVRAALPSKPDLASALDRLDARHFTSPVPVAAPPGARRLPEKVGARLLDEKGALKRYVNVFHNDEDVRFLKQLDTHVKEDDRLSIIPAIAGTRLMRGVIFISVLAAPFVAALLAG